MKGQWRKRVLCLAMAVALMMSGCGAFGVSQALAEEATAYPLDTDVTLTYWREIPSNVQPNFNNLNETEIAKQWRENTGVTLEFLHPAVGQGKEQFNLMIAGGDYPDIWYYSWNEASTYSGGPEKAIEDGVILDLTDLINEYAPNFKAYMEANPELDKQVRTDSGKYYGFPCFKEREEATTTQGPMIRKDLLDKLDLEVPETIDEWHTVLTAFKENGVEIPLQLHYAYKDRTFAHAWGAPEAFVVEDGVCVYGASKPEYKEFLKTMKQWYAEGLLDPDMFANPDDMINKNMASGKAAATITWAGSGMQTILNNAEGDSFELIACPWPTLEKGQTPEYGYRSNRAFGGFAAISSTCKDPVLAVKLLDYGYSEEGNRMFNFGREGVSYTMEGDRPMYTDIIVNNPDGWPVNQAMGKYIMASYDGPYVQSFEYQIQYFVRQEARDAMTIWNNCNSREHVLPNISPSVDESAEYASLIRDIETYVEEMTAKFILGTEDVETGFDAYIETLKKMGLDRATEIMNSALVRYNER